MFKLPENIDMDQVLDSFPGHLYVKDINGVYLGSNNQYNEFLREFGFYRLRTSHEILGKTDYDFFPKEEADRLVENDQEVMRTRVMMLKEESVHDQEGNLHTYISTKIPLLGGDGQTLGIIGTSINICEQAKRKEQFAQKIDSMGILHQQKSFMDNILWCLPEQFYWIDLEGRYVACNEKQAQLFGLTREEIIGKSIDDIARLAGLSDEQREKVHAHNKDVLETRQPITVEETAQVHGNWRTFLSYKNPLFNKKNELIGIYGVSVDITDQKNIEQNLIRQRQKAEAASEAKSQFLMNMSHDIRTPFSGIIGNAELLQRQENDPVKKQKLRQIIDSSSGLLNLLNDIIDVVQLEDQPEIIAEPINLRQSVQKIATIMQVEAEQKNIRLTVDFDNSLPGMVVTNPKAVERLLLNLLGNAVKFTHQGGVELTLSSTNDSQQPKINIVIRDTGIGIEPDQLDIIFEQFTRLTPAFQRHYDGSGLGLWIVKQLLDKLDGTIAIDSELNKGTTISIEIPYQPADSQTVEHSVQPIDLEKLFPNSRILVVEDDPIAAKIAAGFLHDLCHAKIDTASSGQEAFQKVSNQYYDVIILDVGLPDMDGVEVAKKIRVNSGLNQETPIIGLTAHVSIHLDHSMMSDVIEKPLTYQKCEQIGRVIARVKQQSSSEKGIPSEYV